MVLISTFGNGADQQAFAEARMLNIVGHDGAGI